MNRLIAPIRRVRRLAVLASGVCYLICTINALAQNAPSQAARDVRARENAVERDARARAGDITPKAATAEEASLLSPDWIVTVQLGPGAVPIYPGAGRLRAVPIPGVEFRRPYEKERFSAPDDGLSADIIDFGSFRAGPTAFFAPPRDPKYPQTWGLRTVNIAFEFGGFAEYYLGDILRLRAEVRKGLMGHTGYVATISADLVNQSGPVRVSTGPRVRFGSDRYSDAYYGVTPAQSRANRFLPAFEASGGIMSAGLMTTVRYDVSKNWNATAYGGLSRLAGSAAASPIVNMTGSRNQYTFGLLVGRSFEVSGL